MQAEQDFYPCSAKALRYLAGVDPVLGGAIQHLGTIHRPTIRQPFTCLAHTITAQLVSAASAAAIWARMQQKLGPITPQNIAPLPPQALAECGLTRQKAAAIQQAALALTERRFDFEEVKQMDDAHAVEALTTLRGVGRWSAEMLLLHALHRPDILSGGDAALRRGLQKLHHLPPLSPQQFDNFKRLYSPHGSAAAVYLWEIAKPDFTPT
ncbi:MAG: DNA-3-methyladenine glycosylase family protein [Oscillospiraceae bacterium]